MSEKRTLTLRGMTIPHTLYLLLNVIGIGVTLYLTKHYYESNFPTGFGQASSVCDISSFFNCDAATFSSFSNIAGVPISLFGLIVHLCFIGSSIFGTEKSESTNKFIALLNAIGCLFLLVYSLTVLHSLCPLCSIYYLLSFTIFFFYFKFSELPWAPNFGILAIYGAVLLGISAVTYFETQGNDKKQEQISSQIIDQYFNKLENLGNPEYESPFWIAKSKESLTQTPLWIAYFSDFQCPFCARTTDLLEKIKNRYGDKVNIQYFFYPLDNACNPEINRAFHQFACKAAVLAACDQSQFKSIHDELFESQENINDDFIVELEKRHGLSGCLENETAKGYVKSSIEQAIKYKVKSTPTLIVNGVKIEGALPAIHFFKLFDEIIKRNGGQ
ncbi:MAG: thioredoxin domain-containing protein [Halobacteriovoraceae bacterium]|nr:thioredoxin domain-containing protein [Halobacteriovoraceae bacterium]MCB9095783.1 thioredoxin domain-containing protein [Halobacteriovoraceae bacterium]